MWGNRLRVWIKIWFGDSFFPPEWSETEKETSRLEWSPWQVKKLSDRVCIVDATDHPMHKSLPLGTWHKAFRRIILIHLANGCGQNPSPLTTTCIFNITSYSLLPLPKQPPHGVLPDSLSTSGLFMTLSFTVALVSLTKSLVFFLFNMQLFVLSFVFATVLGSWVCTSTESVVSILFLSFCKKGFYLFIYF